MGSFDDNINESLDQFYSKPAPGSREEHMENMVPFIEKHKLDLPFEKMRPSENVTVDPSVNRSGFMKLIHEFFVPQLSNTYTGKATETVELPGSREILEDIGRR